MHSLTLLSSGLVGLFLLVLGSELLVRGSVKLARRFGVSELLIGLILVGFGTSAPVLVASLQASFASAPDVALGIVIGSNIASLLLVLGLSAVARPIVVNRSSVQKDLALLLVFTGILVVILLIFSLSRGVACLLVGLLLVYVRFSVSKARLDLRSSDAAAAQRSDNPPKEGASVILPIIVTCAGLVLLIFGGDLLVDAVAVGAHQFGIPEAIIGLTMVALGTTLPELSASLVAARKGKHDVAIGNVIGSNIFNTLAIVGLIGLVSPLSAVPGVLVSHGVLMLGITFLVGFLLMARRTLTRIEGVLLIVVYLLYLIALFSA